jgi:archaellum biogenesis ATPase FlaH
MVNEKGLPETAPEQVDLLNIIVSRERSIGNILEKANDIELAGPLAKGMINVFIATSGSGKSLLAFLISWKELQAKNFSRVFYIDLDNPHSIYKDRYSSFPRLQGFLYLTEYVLLELSEVPGVMPVDKAWHLLEALATSKYTANSLVVLDSLQNIVDYNDKREINKLFGVCRAITFAGGTVLLLHHKSAKADSPGFKGLSLIQDFPDVMWEVTPQKRRSGEIASFQLTCIKNRSTTNFSGFNITFSTDQGSVDYGQDVLLEEEIPVKEMVLTVLRGKEMKQTDIVEAVKQKASDSGKTIGEKKIRSILGKLAALHILNVRTVKTAKLYSINYNSIEPGYWDAVEDDIPDDDKVALPF